MAAMFVESTPDITALLARWREGDKAAESELLTAVYPVLRATASARVRGTDLTLSATELAHETYLRLCRNDSIDFRDRSHFFAVAARATRHFVIDYVRARDRDKRGGGVPLVKFEDAADEMAGDRIDLEADWLAVHEALTVLERSDPACVQVVELKFFSGLTTDEIAKVLHISSASVVRYWRFAKAWLVGRLGMPG